MAKKIVETQDSTGKDREVELIGKHVDVEPQIVTVIGGTTPVETKIVDQRGENK